MIYLKAALFFPRLTKAEQRKEAHVKICKKAGILQDKRHTKIFQKFPSAGLNAAYSFYYAFSKGMCRSMAALDSPDDSGEDWSAATLGKVHRSSPFACYLVRFQVLPIHRIARNPHFS